MTETEREWKAKLAAAHPDRGGNVETFLALNRAREEWRAAHGTCAQCGKPYTRRKQQRGLDRYCTRHCANLAMADRRRLRRLAA